MGSGLRRAPQGSITGPPLLPRKTGRASEMICAVAPRDVVWSVYGDAGSHTTPLCI